MIYKTKDGITKKTGKERTVKYAVRIDEVTGGVRKRKVVGTFEKLKDAERAERQALTKRDNGQRIAHRPILLSELLNQYISDRESLAGLSPKTIEEYRGLARSYITAHFPKIRADKLRPADVGKWLKTIRGKGGREGAPISAKTAKNAFALMRSALNWAMKMEMIGRNVCNNVDPPATTHGEAKALSADEIGRLSEAVAGTRWEHFLGLALMLGARRGELLALHWRDIDLKIGRVVLRASLSQTKAKVELKSTKTGRVRVVPLSASGRKIMQRQMDLQARDRDVAGEYYRNLEDAVFTDELGARLSPKAATNAFARYAKKAKLSTTSLHSTRHTTATQLIGNGVDVRTVAGILGHANASVTLGIYAHLMEGAERAAIDLLSDRIDLAAAPKEEKPPGAAPKVPV